MNQSNGAIKLIDYIEDAFFQLIRRSMRGEQSSDAKMSPGTGLLGKERIGRFLDAVMGKLIGCFVDQ